ncbi:unnamed protein product [marine sediment metagenome]|uniref:Uncharacterized protein n=1 Tax=marine sediment metagenome TaxID=412755 RepID=X1S1S1_9ZZZZ
MTEIRNAILKALIKNDIFPSPFIELSVWIEMYVPNMFDKDIMDALREEEENV